MKLDIRDRIQFKTYIEGEYCEVGTQALLKTLIESKSCFIDIGANIGYYSLMVAAIASDSQIIAFEPLPKNVIAFKENILLNNFSNIRIEEIALSDEDGTGILAFTDPQTESGWAFLLPSPSESYAVNLQVRKAKLDTVLELLKIPKADILKIDVEGHDYQVIKGAEKTLTAPGKRHVIIEFNDWMFQNQGSVIQRTNEFLKEKGYKLFSIEEGGKTSSIDKPFGGSEEMNFYYFKEK